MPKWKRIETAPVNKRILIARRDSYGNRYVEIVEEDNGYEWVPFDPDVKGLDLPYAWAEVPEAPEFSEVE